MAQISSSRASSTSKASPVAGGVIVVGVVWYVLGLIFAPMMSALEFTFSLCLEVGFGLVVGAWHGLQFGFSAVKALATFTLIQPSIGSVLAGIGAGLVITVLARAWDVHEKKSSPLVDALTSPDVWQSRSFYLMVFINVLVGYLTTAALSAVGLIANASSAVGPDLHHVATIVSGYGAGGGGDALDAIGNFVLVLVALIVIGFIAGGFVGTVLGILSGPGPWILDFNAGIQGAAEGATTCLLEPKDKAAQPRTIGERVLLGASAGFADGMIAGAAVGFILALGHLGG